MSQTRQVIDAMREVGAVSPATARPVGLLPDEVRMDLERLLQSGLIREGAPGSFYLFAPATPPRTAARIVKAVLFWLLVIILPVVILQLSNTRSTP